MLRLNCLVATCVLALTVGDLAPARAATTLTIDFVSTATDLGDVLQGNLIIDETANKITGITNDFNGCCSLPDPNFQFSNLNSGNPLFNVGDSATATAIPGTSQVISDSTTGVTLDWTSVTSNVFPGFVNVSFNGTGPGGGPNTIEVGGLVEANFTPGDSVVEIASTTTTTTTLPAALPLFATGLGGLGLLGWRRKRKARGSLLGAA